MIFVNKGILHKSLEPYKLTNGEAVFFSETAFDSFNIILFQGAP